MPCSLPCSFRLPEHRADAHGRPATSALPRWPALSLGLFAVGACASGAWGQAFTLRSFTVDGGGGAALAPGWSLQCTLGQADAGTMSGGPWTLALGYWPSTGSPPPPGCVADVDDGSGTGTPDGGVTIDDLLYYLAIFEAGVVGADVDDGSFTGTRDGGVTIDDLLYYLFRFEVGC